MMGLRQWHLVASNPVVSFSPHCLGRGNGGNGQDQGPPSPLVGPVGGSNGSTSGDSVRDKVNGTVTISQDEVLMENDILWWSGSGNAIGELRKIPGLAPLETEQISKIGQSSDRRLVQAVVARKGPLVGKR